MVSLGRSQWGCCWISTTRREKEERSTRLRMVTTRNSQNLFLSFWVWANFHIPNSVTEEVIESLGEGAWNYDSPCSFRKGTHHLLKELYIWKRRICKHFEDFRHRTWTDTDALRPKASSLFPLEEVISAVPKCLVELIYSGVTSTLGPWPTREGLSLWERQSKNLWNSPTLQPW